MAKVKVTEVKEKVASAFALERKITPSDGYLYGKVWGSTEKKALTLVEKTIRGTKSNRQDEKTLKDSKKLMKEVSGANPQKVDACFLAENQDTVELLFSVKFLGQVNKPTVCNEFAFLKKYQTAVNAYIKEKDSFEELALRYVMNLVNGRVLWRNRFGAKKIRTVIKIEGRDPWVFENSKGFHLFDFEQAKENKNITEVADLVAAAFRSDNDFVILEVNIEAQIGFGQEVYPSEELVYSKDKDDKSKILYSVNGIAALHSQKIGNAIRTIDTWYESDEFDQPIPVEPYGSVPTCGYAFRTDKKHNFYDLMENYLLKDEDLADQKNYFYAMLIRGGVFGKKSDDK